MQTTHEEWRYLYHERAAILEHDGRHSRSYAESLAIKILREQGCPEFMLRFLKTENLKL